MFSRGIAAAALGAACLLAGPVLAQEDEPPPPENPKTAPTSEQAPSPPAPSPSAPAPTAPAPAPSPPAAAPRPAVLAPPPVRPLRLDYDAPAQPRTALDFARATAYLMTSNYVIFQTDWLSKREYIFVSGRALKRNLHEGFAWDSDPLQTNFFGHPLHGSMYFSGARAAGLSFWESIPFSFAGSFSWELFGETERPSANDLAATSLGGIFLGEILHRLSSQVLDDSKEGPNRLGRELLAAAIDPMRGIDRVLTGKAWKAGPAGEPRDTRVELNLGIDRVHLQDYERSTDGRNLDPSLLAALAIHYGGLRPIAGKDRLGPFEDFQLYAAVNLLQSELTGVQVFEHGVLYGFSHPVTSDEGPGEDNNVFGFFQSFDFQGANLATFGALGIGPGDHVVFRTRKVGSIHVGLDLEWVPVFGLTSRNVGSSLRDYNIITGGAVGFYAGWHFGRPGRLMLRAKNYVGSIVDGAEGVEYAGYTRLSYEVDIVPGLLGVGLAPLTIQRGSNYGRGVQERGTQASTQFYLTVHN